MGFRYIPFSGTKYKQRNTADHQLHKNKQRACVGERDPLNCQTSYTYFVWVSLLPLLCSLSCPPQHLFCGIHTGIFFFSHFFNYLDFFSHGFSWINVEGGQERLHEYSKLIGIA